MARNSGPDDNRRVRMPFGHALFVSAQSIRNRFGRNLITLAGIALGIAFLMSVFTGDLVDRALKGHSEREERLQAAVARITSDIGRLEGKRLAVVGLVPRTGPWAPLMGRLVSKGARLCLWPRQELDARRVPDVSADDRQRQVSVADSLGDACKDAEAMLWIGDGGSPLAVSALVVVKDRLAGRVVMDLSPLADPDAPPVDLLTRLAAVTQKAPDGKEAPLFSVARVGQSDPEARRLHEQDARQARARTYWLVGVSILVSFIGIANAMLMSVYERFREIGTMKCLGAVNSFVVLIFLLESAFQGLVGAIGGVVVGFLFSMLAYAFSEGFGPVFGSLNYADVLAKAGLSVVFGALLGVGAAIGPARRAACMVPADALRTEI